jgi:hypothetical protein
MASIQLQKFSESEILLSQHEAWSVLRFFWPGSSVNPGNLNNQDRAFAQALLVEAIDRSYEMGYVEILFRNFFGVGVAPSYNAIRKAVKSFAKQAVKHWFKHAKKEDLEDPEIYESIRASLARNFRSVWLTREQGGGLLY